MNITPKHNCVFTSIGPVEQVPIALVTAPVKALRAYKARHVRHAVKTVEATGFVQPIIIDPDGVVIAGLIFFLAARELELAEIPVIRCVHLSHAQREIYRIAEQRLAEFAPWDEKALAETLKFLSDLDLDFSLDATGFSTTEIDLKIDSEFNSRVSVGPTDETDTDLLRTAPTSIKGDLWTLGRHKILCSDASLEDSYQNLMAGASASALSTDPPYGGSIAGYIPGNGKVRHREFAMASGEMSDQELTRFQSSWLRNTLQHLKPGALQYIFMDWRHAKNILLIAEELTLELKNICVWMKTNAGMGSMYRSQHELVFVLKYGKARHRNNIELGRNGRNRTNVWTYPGANSFERHSEEGNLLSFHPTTKSIQMLADIMLDCTQRNDIVLDPFLGSGSNLLAAERVGRKLYGIGIDPIYVDLAIRRWQRLTGQTAMHAALNRSFDSVAAERSGS